MGKFMHPYIMFMQHGVQATIDKSPARKDGEVMWSLSLRLGMTEQKSLFLGNQGKMLITDMHV